MGRGCTWPPEKPTATTPSSLLLVKNLGAMVDGEVMMIVGGTIFGVVGSVVERCGRIASRHKGIFKPSEEDKANLEVKNKTTLRQPRRKRGKDCEFYSMSREEALANQNIYVRL